MGITSDFIYLFNCIHISLHQSYTLSKLNDWNSASILFAPLRILTILWKKINYLDSSELSFLFSEGWVLFYFFTYQEKNAMMWPGFKNDYS